MATAGPRDEHGNGRLAAIVVSLATLAGLTVFGLVSVRPDIEQTLEADSERALAAAGFDDVVVDVEGRDVRLSGSLDDEAQLGVVLDELDGVDGVRGVITDDVQVAGARGEGGPAATGGQAVAAAGSDAEQASSGGASIQPQVELVSTYDRLRLEGVVGSADQAYSLLDAATEAAGQRAVDNAVIVLDAIAPLDEQQLEDLAPLMRWVTRSADEPWRSGVGFSLTGPHLQFYGDVAAESRAAAEDAGPTIVGEGGTLDLADLSIIDQAPGEGVEGVQVRGGIAYYGPPVSFDSGVAVVQPEAVANILAIVDVLRSEGVERVTVAGYTDADGPDSVNLALSRRRAASVAQQLSAAIPTLEVEVVGRGEEGLAENPARSRRVEVSEVLDVP